MTKVCRLCLLKLQRGSRYFNVNAVESSTGFMPYRDQLTTCIPEMALDLIPNPVICNNCRNTLKSAYEFKSRCLKTEKKIREYVEKQPANCTTYNLAEIDSFSRLAKPVKVDRLEIKLIGNSPKFLPILPKVTKKDTNHQQSTSSILSNLLSVQEELRLPNRSEIEITNVNVEVSKGKRIRKISAIQTEVQTLAQTAPEISFTPLMPKDEHGLFTCNHCDKKFPNIPLLHSHKTKIHEEDYLCNFCNSPFKTLQSLRKHNQQCQKSNVASTIQNVITKRPHLPTKAKNHLKRWLFDHTDHPYPTDMEKQQLMKETNLSLLQVENWFINARRRILADLTRLKNMSGNFPKGRGRGRANRRARGKLDFVLDDFLLYEDVSAEESAAAVKTAVACNRTNTVVALPAPMKQENVDKNDNREEDIEDIKPQFRIPIEIATVKEDDRFFENVDMDAEDPLEKDIPLNLLTKDVKMEVDLDR